MQLPEPSAENPSGPVIDELSAHEEVIAIILFGSVARGQARKDSDIDICVIARHNTPETVMMDLLSYGSEKMDISLFRDLPITIRFNAIRDGRILFCRDLPELRRIMADTVREYLDIAPLIRRSSLHAIGISGA
jgi:uncharacterized protein